MVVEWKASLACVGRLKRRSGRGWDIDQSNLALKSMASLDTLDLPAAARLIWWCIG